MLSSYNKKAMLSQGNRAMLL